MSTSKYNDRYYLRHYQCPVLGSLKNLPRARLPTYRDVLSACILESIERGKSKSGQHPPITDIAESISSMVENMYSELGIPILTHIRVRTLILNYHKKYNDIKRIVKRKDESEHSKSRVEGFLIDSLKLFDIAACKCQSSESCNCPKDRKVPKEAMEFLQDQRTTRQMEMNICDPSEIGCLKRKSENRNENPTSNKKARSDVTNPQDTLSPPQAEDSQNTPDSEEFYRPSPEQMPSSSTRVRVELPHTAAVCHRFGIPDRAAAALATSVLLDVEMATGSLQSFVIDKNKIRREKSKFAGNLRGDGGEDDPIHALYFDGRRDKTKFMDQKDSKYYPTEIIEDHYSLIEEPSSKYITHLSPSTGSAACISRCIVSYIEENHPRTLDYLEAIGCDGTVVNTGSKNGVITAIENEVERPLQRFICLLHFNELPLRHLFQKLDGVASGPKSFTGTIGKMLPGCENMPIVKFKALDCNLPELDSVELSKDQKYLYNICLAIKSGNCDADLANKNPGKLNLSRWVTLSNRVLRFYVSKENPSLELQIMVEFILKVYAPSWFRIKIRHSVSDGARNLFDFIKASRYLPEQYLQIIDPVIQRNAYFAAPENILLSMLTDENVQVRRTALNRIIQARELEAIQRNDLPTFEVPKLNFRAGTYVDMIDWSNARVRSPPVLRALGTDEIKMYLEGDDIPVSWQFSKYPCHTQAVERMVKLVTEASSKVYGKKKREEYILATLQSRQIMAKFDSKKDFKAL